MAKKNKLQKFAELYELANVYQNLEGKEPVLTHLDDNEVRMSGKWCAQQFKNQNDLVLELACGKGEYTRNLATEYPDKNFIGVDLKGNRIWKGATEALNNGIHNAAFLRTRIELMEQFFAPDEVSEIWITFPDPHLRNAKSDKRLTSPRYLDLYRKFLKPGGIIHLKTDDPTLYAYTLRTLADYPSEIIYQKDDIYAEELAYPELRFKTYYEGMHLEIGRKIKYVRFRLK